MSVLPAVPVFLPDHGNLSTLGIIDPGAAVSCISEKLVEDSRFGLSKPERYFAVNMAGSVIHVPMITADLIIADADFDPWLRIHRMSFAVTPTSQWVSEAAAIILGYPGCLEYLTVEFDFPHRVVSISAPAKFDLKRKKEAELLEPSRLREAEVLLRLGSYDSAVMMAVSAIEEVARTISTVVPDEMRRSVILRLEKDLPSELWASLKSLMRLRNEAVHGVARGITKTEAEQVIHDASRIVRHLSRVSPPS
jgi:HEPN domain-containing protein